jgi:hypothetical protein
MINLIKRLLQFKNHANQTNPVQTFFSEGKDHSITRQTVNLPDTLTLQFLPTLSGLIVFLILSLFSRIQSSRFYLQRQTRPLKKGYYASGSF